MEASPPSGAPGLAAPVTPAHAPAAAAGPPRQYLRVDIAPFTTVADLDQVIKAHIPLPPSLHAYEVEVNICVWPASGAKGVSLANSAIFKGGSPEFTQKLMDLFQNHTLVSVPMAPTYITAAEAANRGDLNPDERLEKLSKDSIV